MATIGYALRLHLHFIMNRCRKGVKKIKEKKYADLVTTISATMSR